MTFPKNPWIDGKAREPREGRRMELINPASGEPFAEVSGAGLRDVEDAVAGAQHAFENGWRDLAPGKRAAILFAVAAKLRAHAEDCLLYTSDAADE